MRCGLTPSEHDEILIQSALCNLLSRSVDLMKVLKIGRARRRGFHHFMAAHISGLIRLWPIAIDAVEMPVGHPFQHIYNHIFGSYVAPASLFMR